MKLVELEEAVLKHSGEFLCTSRGGDKSVSKTINFKHNFEPPISSSEVPDIGMLKEFYSTFSCLTLYHHKESDEAAFYIANPKEWDFLREEFSGWIDDLEEDEEEELLPSWIESFITIGEIPHSGNYLLVPISGEMAGHIFEFEHDGFEFIDLATNVNEFIKTCLNPDSRSLTRMASHLTFIEEDPMQQWWIEEMRDNSGNVVRTE